MRAACFLSLSLSLSAADALADRAEQLSNEQALRADLESQVNTVIDAAQAFDLVQHSAPQPTRRHLGGSGSSSPRASGSASRTPPVAVASQSAGRPRAHPSDNPPPHAQTSDRGTPSPRPSPRPLPRPLPQRHRGDDDVDDSLEREQRSPPRPSRSVPRPSLGLGAILKGTSFGGAQHGR
jgi:hypothetical protein